MIEIIFPPTLFFTPSQAGFSTKNPPIADSAVCSLGRLLSTYRPADDRPVYNPDADDKFRYLLRIEGIFGNGGPPKKQEKAQKQWNKNFVAAPPVCNLCFTRQKRLWGRKVPCSMPPTSTRFTAMALNVVVDWPEDMYFLWLLEFYFYYICIDLRRQGRTSNKIARNQHNSFQLPLFGRPPSPYLNYHLESLCTAN